VRRAAAVGGVVGASLGAIGGALFYAPCQSTEFSGCLLAPNSRSESAQVNGLIYGLLGLIGGGVVGLVPRDRWQRVTPDGNGVRFTHHTLPRGGRGVGLALAY
jgi:tetrahydromethanopterin S-methyltransferase subunit D